MSTGAWLSLVAPQGHHPPLQGPNPCWWQLAILGLPEKLMLLRALGYLLCGLEPPLICLHRCVHQTTIDNEAQPGGPLRLCPLPSLPGAITKLQR